MRQARGNLARGFRKAATALALLVCFGCAGSTTDSTSAGASIAGTWKSIDADAGFVVALTLSESGSVVSGIGNTNENPPALIDVTGSYQSPNVELTLKVLPQGTVDQNGATISYSATTTSATTMAGTISGGGQADHNATFTRQ